MRTLAQLARRKSLRVAGLMSGTSADGVDVAFVDISRRSVAVKAFGTYPYTTSMRRAVLQLSGGETASVDDLCHLNFAIGEVFAAAVVRLAKDSRVALGTIDPCRLARSDRSPPSSRAAIRADKAPLDASDRRAERDSRADGHNDCGGLPPARRCRRRAGRPARAVRRSRAVLTPAPVTGCAEHRGHRQRDFPSARRAVRGYRGLRHRARGTWSSTAPPAP